jgi:hypothetical protein
MEGASTLYWDFFGPRAEGTARHFRGHLDDFLARERLAGCVTGVEEVAAAHWATWCRAGQEAREPLRRALRPKRERVEPGERSEPSRSSEPGQPTGP